MNLVFRFYNEERNKVKALYLSPVIIEVGLNAVNVLKHFLVSNWNIRCLYAKSYTSLYE